MSDVCLIIHQCALLQILQMFILLCCASSTVQCPFHFETNERRHRALYRGPVRGHWARPWESESWLLVPFPLLFCLIDGSGNQQQCV